ncbi:sugar phosphate isomerase/epimerase [Arsenicitalea aurantiaca]|uniref:Sugar phosphate isomerase/epimerase n=1 Tax=Arsenicitalea aurantiaca TaxID=1783274 RepID=A0A433XLA1_9HYPH|nr:sugar phosphate isomerase/epimerase [Arsenicitalea aurantiaca]RUT34859.1 sugar phosphate isomerase/epimerase [Arsenicitalea aurantiaca]
MRTIKGPGLFLAQFAQDTAPHNSLEGIARWARDYGYEGIQIPSWDARFFDLDKAYESETYCDEIKGKLSDIGIAITELSTHFQGQMVSVHPAYDAMFDGQCPPHLRGNPEKRRLWAAEQVTKAAKVSARLGLTEHVSFTGSLAWPYFYPYPQRPTGLIEECFAEQGRRWTPILNAYEDAGVDLCFEIHPTEDVFDGDTFEMFLDAVGGHSRCNINYDASHFIKQGMDYLGFIDVFHERIKMFHVKDAEFNPTAKQGYLGGYKGWLERAARDRSLGHGQVDFKGVFSKMAQYDFAGWAVYEWECCLEHPEVAAREGAKFISSHIIEVTDRVFDDFAATGADANVNRQLLGLKG